MRTDAGDAAVSGWKLPGLPEVEAALARHVVPRILMAGDIAFSGTLPAAARTVSIRLPYVLGETVHVYAVPGGDGEGQLVAAGDYSNVVRFKLRTVQTQRAPAPARPSWRDGHGNRGGRRGFADRVVVCAAVRGTGGSA